MGFLTLKVKNLCVRFALKRTSTIIILDYEGFRVFEKLILVNESDKGLIVDQYHLPTFSDMRTLLLLVEDWTVPRVPTNDLSLRRRSEVEL